MNEKVGEKCQRSYDLLEELVSWNRRKNASKGYIAQANQHFEKEKIDNQGFIA